MKVMTLHVGFLLCARLLAALSLVMLLYLWGSCIAYLVIIGDSFSPLLKMAVGEHHLSRNKHTLECGTYTKACP